MGSESRVTLHSGPAGQQLYPPLSYPTIPTPLRPPAPSPVPAKRGPQPCYPHLTNTCLQPLAIQKLKQICWSPLTTQGGVRAPSARSPGTLGMSLTPLSSLRKHPGPRCPPCKRQHPGPHPQPLPGLWPVHCPQETGFPGRKVLTPGTIFHMLSFILVSSTRPPSRAPGLPTSLQPGQDRPGQCTCVLLLAKPGPCAPVFCPACCLLRLAGHELLRTNPPCEASHGPRGHTSRGLPSRVGSGLPDSLGTAWAPEDIPNPQLILLGGGFHREPRFPGEAHH